MNEKFSMKFFGRFNYKLNYKTHSKKLHVSFEINLYSRNVYWEIFLLSLKIGIVIRTLLRNVIKNIFKLESSQLFIKHLTSYFYPIISY